MNIFIIVITLCCTIRVVNPLMCYSDSCAIGNCYGPQHVKECGAIVKSCYTEIASGRLNWGCSDPHYGCHPQSTVFIYMQCCFSNICNSNVRKKINNILVFLMVFVHIINRFQICK